MKRLAIVFMLMLSGCTFHHHHDGMREFIFETDAEAYAFIQGIEFVDDYDHYRVLPVEKVHGLWVVRVRIQ